MQLDQISVPTRMQMASQQGMAASANAPIAHMRKLGLRNLYRGASATLLRDAAWAPLRRKVLLIAISVASEMAAHNLWSMFITNASRSDGKSEILLPIAAVLYCVSIVCHLAAQYIPIDPKSAQARRQRVERRDLRGARQAGRALARIALRLALEHVLVPQRHAVLQHQAHLLALGRQLVVRGQDAPVRVVRGLVRGRVRGRVRGLVVLDRQRALRAQRIPRGILQTLF